MAGKGWARGARRFGSIRQLRSGRYQARYIADGVERTAPRTFPTRRDAEVYLDTVRADMVRGVLSGTRESRETLADYGRRWIEMHQGLKRSTRSQYASDFRLHIEPYLGRHRLPRITPDMVRQWLHRLGVDLADKLAAEGMRTSSATNRDGSATKARSYRLLHAIYATAAEDGLVQSNPCRIKGAGTYHHAERPVLSVAEVQHLADVVPSRYRALVLLLAWSGLRIGECAALRRVDFDLDPERPSVRVSQRAYRVGGDVDFDAPKSAAGVRTVALPPHLVPVLRDHLETYAEPLSLSGLAFTTAKGGDILGTYSGVMRRGLAAIGHPDVRVHDLRHFGQVLAAEAGASLPELMRRMGHSTVDAARAYMHATEQHGDEIAARMSARATSAGVVDISTAKRVNSRAR
jgi:integrase